MSARHGGMYRLRRFAARHKFQVAAVLIVVLAVAASAAVSFRQARTASRERDRAFALASRNAAISEFTERLLVEAAASKAPITVRDILAKSEVMLLADEADSVENRAAVLNLIAGRYYEVGDIRKALELREHALSLIEGSKDTELRSYLICAHAYSLHRLGQTEEAARRIERELDHLDSASSTSAGCHYYLSAVRETLGDGEGALRSALRALREYQAAPDKTAGEEISILGAVAMAYNSMGNVEQASQYFGFGLDKLKTLGRERSTEAMTMRNNLAVLSISAGVPKRALAMFDELLDDAAESKLSTQANAAHVINRARALDLIGRFSEAKETYQHCLNLAEQQQDITAQTTCLVGLASVAQRSGDRAAAELFLAKADQAGGATMRDSAPMKTRALIQGRLDLADGNLESARENFELSRSGNKKPSGRIDTTLAMAELELSSGNIAAAISNAQAALAISKSQQGDEKFSNRTGLSSLMLGRALQKQGNMVEARDAFETAVAHLSNTVDEQHPALVQARQLLSSST